MCKVSHPTSLQGSSGQFSKVILVGFSVRSLAEATVAATGVQPISVDHFADHDCRRISSASIRMSGWGDDGTSVLTALRGHRALRSHWGANSLVLLSGGTENQPQLVEMLHQEFMVCGPTASQSLWLRCRDSWRSLCVHSQICFPETRDALPNSPAGDESWILKPTSGAGGFAIRRNSIYRSGSALPPALEDNAWLPPHSRSHYWQREIQGKSLGVYCVLDPKQSIILGATESYDSRDWPGPSEFIYRGSWGPVPLSGSQQEQVLELCRRVYLSTGSIGWHQFDFIVDDHGKLWLLEINPRWTAGMEVLFLAGVNPVEYHLRAWKLTRPSCEAVTPALAGSGIARFGKAVVYAEQELHLTKQRIAALHALNPVNFADLPALDMEEHVVAPGQPLLTVRTQDCSADHRDIVRENLLRELARFRSQALNVS